MDRTAMLVFAYDSQFKWVRGIGDVLARRGVTCRYVVPSDVRNSVSDAQLADHGSAQVEYLPFADIVSGALASDVLVLGVQGPLGFRLQMEMADVLGSADVRPVVVAGWVGVIIEKRVAGYLERCPADVVAVNSSSDLAEFHLAADALRLDPSNLLLTGLPILPAKAEPTVEAPIRTVLFADQPTVPGPSVERRYLYERLAEHARLHPDRRVLLKPRHRPDEDTFHKMVHHPANLLAGVELPENMSIDYTPISEMLDEVDLLLTVSSTAGLESVGRGVRTAFVADLGVHERHGNHVFLTSGLLRTFDQIDADDLGLPSQDWLDDVFVAGEQTPAERAVDRAVELADVAPADRPSAAVLASTYIRGRREAVLGLAEVTERARAAREARPAPRRPRPATRTRTLRWVPGVRGRVVLIANALLPVRVADRIRRRRRVARVS